LKIVVVPMVDGGEVEKLSHYPSSIPWNIENNFKDFSVSWWGAVVGLAHCNTGEPLHSMKGVQFLAHLRYCQLLNPLSPELNPVCYLLALLDHDFLHVSRIRVKIINP
jgi:hypothetical protein